MDLQKRKGPVLSKCPFMLYHHMKTYFCAEDLFASTKLVDISCTCCLPLSNRKISLWMWMVGHDLLTEILWQTRALLAEALVNICARRQIKTEELVGSSQSGPFWVETEKGL